MVKLVQAGERNVSTLYEVPSFVAIFLPCWIWGLISEYASLARWDPVPQSLLGFVIIPERRFETRHLSLSLPPIELLLASIPQISNKCWAWSKVKESGHNARLAFWVILKGHFEVNRLNVEIKRNSAECMEKWESFSLKWTSLRSPVTRVLLAAFRFADTATDWRYLWLRWKSPVLH